MNIDTLSIKVSTSGISDANSQLKKLGETATTTEQKVKQLVDRVNEMVNKFSSSVTSTAAMTQALTVVNKSTQASDAAMKTLATSVSTLSDKIGKLSTDFSKVSTTTNTSTVSITHHAAAMTDAHAAARGLTGSLGALWLTYGNLAPLAAGAAIGSAMKEIISVGVDVENTLENIRIKGENTTEEMKDMRKAISDLGQGIYGPQEITKALETLTLAGLRATEAVQAIGAAKNLAIVGGTDINKAAESLVTIGSAVGATASQYDYLADGIAKAANISLASVESISESVKRASVVNKLYGASFEDILTQTAALAQLGIKNSAAGTAITNFYANAMGNSQKAKQALDALGFSFQDATGKAKPLVQAYEEFTEKLNKFDLKSQQKIITSIFGERALRDVEGIRDMVNSVADSTERLADGTLKYKNKLEELQDQVKNSAGTAAVQAAEQSLTTENQLKSMVNTLKSSFGEAFKEIEPQVDNISRKLKEVFSSQDFQNVLANIAQGFVSVASAIVNNINALEKMVELILVYSAAMAGGALFARIVPAIKALEIGFWALTAAITGSAGATNAFGLAIKGLPGIGMILAAATAAYLIYSAHADKAAESTKKLADEKANLAAQYSGDFLKALDDEASRLNKVNTAMLEGLGIQEATLKATRETNLEKLRAKNQDSVDAAQKILDEAKKKQKDHVGDYINSGNYKAEVDAAQKSLDLAKQKLKADEEHARNTLNEIEAYTHFQQVMKDDAQMQKDLIAANKAGTGVYTGEKEKKGNNLFDALILSNEKWTAGHSARIEMLQQEGDVSLQVAGEVATREAEALLRSDEAKKLMKDMTAEQQKRYTWEVMLSAVNRDNTKFDEDRAKALHDFTKKLDDGIAGYEAYKKSIVDGTQDVVGGMGKQATRLAELLKLDKDQTEALVAKAKAYDQNKVAADEIQKIESKGKSAASTAEALMAQAQAMSEYGTRAKSTALDLALAETANLKYSDSATQVAASNYAADASFKTVAQALVNITKVGQQAEDDEKKAQADSLLIFADSEKQKIQIKADNLKKIIQMNKAQALSAALANGDQRSWDAYEKLAAEAERAIEQIDKDTKTRMHNVELQDWKKIVNSIVDAGLAGFEKIFDKGTSGWSAFIKGIRDMFKKLVLDFIAKEFAKPILLNIVAGVSGSLGMNGIANTAAAMLSGGDKNGGSNGVGSTLSIANILSKGFDGINTTVGNAISSIGNLLGSQGISSFGSGISAGVNAGQAASAYAAAGNTTVASGLSMGSQVAAMLPTVVGAVASYFGAKAIANGYKIEGGLGNVLNFAGLFGGVLNRAFGMRSKEVTAQGIRGNLTDSSVIGNTYSDWIQKGGWFRSDKKGTDTSAISTDVQNTLISGFNTVKNVSENFAKTLGITSNALDGFSKVFDIQFKGLQEVKGTAEEQAKIVAANEKIMEDAVSKFFSGLGDEFANALVPDLADFARQGETASQTLQRLAGVFDATNQMAQLLGVDVIKAFGSIGLSSDKARERLVDMAGGASQLVTATSNYVNSIYSDAEKIVPVQKMLNEAFASIGVAVPASKEAFKSLVDGLDLTTENGAKLYTSLTSLAPAFAQVIDAQDKLAEEAKKKAEEEAKKAEDALTKATKLKNDYLSIQAKLAEVDKNEIAAAVIKKQQREQELAAMDESLRPFQEHLYQQQDQNDAVAKAISLSKSDLSLQLEIYKTLGDTVSVQAIVNAQRQIELATMDASLVPLQERLNKIQDEAAATAKANDIRKSELSIMSETYKVLGDTASANIVVSEQRRMELAAMDASLRPLQQRLYQLQDEADALNKINDIHKQGLSLALTIAEYEKNDVARTQIITEQRRLEMQAMDASLKPLQQRVYAIEDEKYAMDKLTSAADTAIGKLQSAVDKENQIIKDRYSNQIDDVKANEKVLEKALKESYTMQIDQAKRVAKAQIDVVKANTKQQVEDLKSKQDVAKKAQQEIQTIFNAITNAIGNTKIESLALDKVRRQSAQTLLKNAATSAKAGMDVRNISGLSEALDVISKPNTDFFKTFQEYAVDQAMAADSLNNLKDSTQSQLDYQQLTIDKLDDTINTIQNSSDIQIQAIQDQTDAYVQSLQNAQDAAVQALQEATDKQVKELEDQRDVLVAKNNELVDVAKMQLDALKGIDVSVLSLKEAMSAVNSALSNAQAQVAASKAAQSGANLVPSIPKAAAPINTQDAQKQVISNLYNLYLGREPDAAGLQYWMDSYNKNNLSYSDVAASMMQSQEYQNKIAANIPKFAQGTNNIPHDMLALVHKGERVIPAADNAELMRRLDSDNTSSSNSDVVDAINGLRSDLRLGDLATNQKLTEFVRIIKRWDGEGMPGTRPGVILDVNVI